MRIFDSAIFINSIASDVNFKRIVTALFCLCLGLPVYSQVISLIPGYTYVKVISKENFSHQTDSVLQKALFLVDSVINTKKFRDVIRSSVFVNAKDCSNDQILDLFLKGHESWSLRANDTMDLNLAVYPDQNGDNIGTTYNSKKIVSSEKYILRNGAGCYAAHIIHEYCHTIGYDGLGFSHIHNTSGGRKREKCLSVPYVIGEIARKELKIKTCYFECEGFKEADGKLRR